MLHIFMATMEVVILSDRSIEPSFPLAMERSPNQIAVCHMDIYIYISFDIWAVFLLQK
jgi:hypothetical protein